MAAITTIGFDADDTLWHNESIFEEAHRRYWTFARSWLYAELTDAPPPGAQ